MSLPQLQSYGSAPWQDSEMLECVMVVPETADSATFTFRAPSGAWFDYKPGQFITLELPVAGGPIHRTYTISSSPSRPLSLSLTVKAHEMGLPDPHYQTSVAGPEYALEFTARAILGDGGEVIGVGTGSSKRKAQLAAAEG